MVDFDFDEEKIMVTPSILFIDYINMQHNDYLKKNFKNITHRDFTYLANIFYHQNISQKELSELLYVSESNVTQIIKRLEKNGLIERHHDEKNKSRKIINLTDEGKLVIFSLMKIVFEWEGEFFKDYRPEEVELFKKMLYEYYKKATYYVHKE
ncbi:MarR family winged helix-turn-helix transcriptional regulator [Methanobrevibacter sp.]|uniref:MarR family winged helix-turn-helix transcriptional regulator n=1 Tax=Methanobrevibacter sp. TaxID=66852 RepID=UPI00388DE315